MARPPERPLMGASLTDSCEAKTGASNDTGTNPTVVNFSPATPLTAKSSHEAPASALSTIQPGAPQSTAQQFATQSPTTAQLFPLKTDASASSRDVLIALTYGLELARHGAMLLEAEGRPHLANSAALAILQKRDGLTLARTGLVAERASDTRLLHKLLQDAITSPQSGEPKESPMTLERKVAKSALIVRVVPGPGLDWPEEGRRTALLKLYDQDMGLVVDQRALSSLYGLTRGEASLATLLIQGRSIEEAAIELYISAHTARTHLKRIFMKTDTHRQTELVVRMLLTIL